MDVRGPDGREWRVRRRWTGRLLPRRRKVDLDGIEPLDVAGAADDPVSFVGAVVVALVLTVVLGLLLITVVPVLVVVVELVVLVVLAALGLLSRVLWLRPWVVEARGSDVVAVERRVRGWRASGRAIRQLADELERGAAP